MKRISRLLFIFLALSVPVSLACGQEEKTEKKIKIVIDDGSGAETVLDTLITEGSLPGSITLKNGKVIIIDEPGTITYTDSGKDHMYVMVTTSDEGKKSAEKTVVIKKGKTAVDDKTKKFDVYVKSESATDENMSRFIIAKNGIVITVEGKDETEVEALRKKIENLLDIGDKEDTGK